MDPISPDDADRERENILKEVLDRYAPKDAEVHTGTNVEMQTELRKRVEAHDHWLFVSYDAHSQRVMQELEDQFYKGKEANDDFTLFISVDQTNPFIRVLGLALAHKRRMTMGELILFQQEHGANCDNPDHEHKVVGAERGDVDMTPIVIPIRPDPSPLDMIRLAVAEEWVAGLLGEEMKRP